MSDPTDPTDPKDPTDPTTAKPAHTVISYEVRDLACQLTDTEKLDRGARMAAAAELAAGLKSEAAGISKQARSHALEAGRIATVVHSGYEMRAISIEWRADYQQRSKTAHRTDTGEALETIALTIGELQTSFAEGSNHPAFAPTPPPPVPISQGRRGRRGRLSAVPNGPTPMSTASAPPGPFVDETAQIGLITHHEYGSTTPSDPVPIPADPTTTTNPEPPTTHAE